MKHTLRSFASSTPLTGISRLCTNFAVLLLLAAGPSAHAADSDFFAYYSHVDSGEPFEKVSRTGDYADLIVKLGEPDGRLVFWRGASYLPYWETAKGKWFLDEIVARRGDGEGKRHDKVNAFSRVALVECTAQRALVTWRYLPEFKPGNPNKDIESNPLRGGVVRGLS